MSSPQGGYLHLLPTVLPQGMTVAALSAALLPWFSPAYSGVVGTSQTAPPEPALAVTFEWPISWLRTAEEIPKFDREWLYVRRFSADQTLTTGQHAFSNVRPGGNPPDTLVTTDQGDLGIESTSLTLQDRRGAHSLFMLLRRRILEQEPAAFSRLSGNLIYVWFEEPGKAELAQPFKRADTVAVADLMQELSTYQPDPAQMWIPHNQLPQQAPPPPPITATSAGARFYCVPLMMSAPSSMLFTIAGFELGLAYTSFITATKAWNEVQRLINAHDQPGVDILLITAGGPDQHGNIFPAEEAAAAFIADHPLTVDKVPQHIKNVWLHSWATGRAIELWPNFHVLFGPLYQNIVPVNHPLVPKPDTAAKAE
jgi:hypothetical protein